MDRSCGHARRSRVLVMLAMFTAACAGRAAFVVPRGPSGPAPEAATVWSALVTACRSTTSYRSEFALTGRIGDRRIRGLASARLFTALAANGNIGLEATVSGQLLFRLGGAAEQATLLLRDENRVATARPAEILDALMGVSIEPARLLAIVSGCVTMTESFSRAVRVGDVIEIATSDATVYLTSAAAGWQARAGRFGDVAVDYFAFDRGLPRELRIATTGTNGAAVTIDLNVRAVQTNGALDPAFFRVVVPDGATPISLDELRRVGPLQDNGSE
jgi:hypothetical protein